MLFKVEDEMYFLPKSSKRDEKRSVILNGIYLKYKTLVCLANEHRGSLYM